MRVDDGIKIEWTIQSKTIIIIIISNVPTIVIWYF